MSEEKKKRIRVVGVNKGRNLELYAKKLEKVMNQLADEDYEISPHEQSTGMILMCTLRRPALDIPEHPLARLLGGLVVPMGGPQESAPWSPKTIELVKRFAKVAHDKSDFAKDMAKYGRECTKDYSVHDLEAVRTEVAQALEEHNKTCNPVDRRAQFWTALIDTLTQVMQQNLQ